MMRAKQQQDGSKGVQVGSRIAIIAETDDDLSTLSLPAEEPFQASSPQETLKSGIDTSKSSEPQAEAPPTSKAEDTPPPKSSQPSSKSSQPASKPQKQTYPLYPSIAQLLHEKGLMSEADQIPASGPKGRLLKGDVLAYLGQINKSYPSQQSARITKLGHLDLSNIKAVPSKPIEPSPPKAPKEPTPEPPTDTKIAIPISLSSVLQVQDRIQQTLGVTLPLSTFLTRAIELANDDLPSSAKPTADDLFNDVLGLSKIGARKMSRGRYMPQITALPSKPFQRPAPRRERDIYDILAGVKEEGRKGGVIPPGMMGGSKEGDSTNVFSVSAKTGEEKRARVFLKRVKTILQVEPGRLIL